MTDDCEPTKRRIFVWEEREARRVFGNRLNYDAVLILECHPLPDRINRLGARLQGRPPPETHNAITLGNRIYFPVRMPQALPAANHPDYFKLLWLIHELTHAWQYQRLGWRYLMRALKAQLSHGIQAYNFGGEAGLLERLEQGARFADFNPEQQGDIVRTYYERLARGQDTHAWNRFIAEVQGIDPPVSMA